MVSTRWSSGLADFDTVQSIRSDVFIKEMNLQKEIVFDEHDAQAQHICLYLADEPIAAARLYFRPDSVRLSHFAVLRQYRGQYFGELCFRLLLHKAQELTRGWVSVLAPLDKAWFYRAFGFREGDCYEPVFFAGTLCTKMQVHKNNIVWDSPCGHHPGR